MTIETGIWNRITESLRSKLSGPEIETWFSQATLGRLEDNNVAIIEVPNKFVARWMRENYLKDIKNSFKSILKETPEIYFRTFKKDKSKISYKLNNNTKYYTPHYLNKSMTFSNFITGDCNRFAFSSALEVSKKPGDHYNPLFFFSKSGVGKTHLLNAMGNYCYNNNPDSKVRYIHSKKMISDFNYFLRNNDVNGFRERYEDIDILLFDDIHYFSNRIKLQEEFLSIFNHLYSEKKQMVITSNHPPDRLKNIGSQLKSRLGWGLIVEIKATSYKTKMKIIHNKIRDHNLSIPNDIISFLAKSDGDLKKLLKDIVRLETYISLNKGDINLSLVNSVIKGRDHVEIGVKDIQSITSGYFNISISDLISEKKKKIYSYPRHIAMYLCRKYTKLSLQDIGYHFGGRDHSTVIYAIGKINSLKSKRKPIRDDLNHIENLLN